MQREKITSISGLRGLSCLIIMLYHYRFVLLDNGVWIIDYGHYFVEMFVTISGFLMAYNYQNKMPDMGIKEFFLKRYMKIMPLYWITEICMYVADVLAVILAGEKYQKNPIHLLWEFSGLYTGWFGQSASPLNSPLWTVNSLLLCYLLYYLICKISKWSYYIYIGVIVGALVGGLWAMWYGPHDIYVYIGNEDSLRCILSFLMGLLLYELYRKISEGWGQIISYILAVLLIVMVIYSNFYLICEMYLEKVISSIVILLVCPFVLFSAIYIKSLKYLFSVRMLQVLSELSMDIYMWHWVVRVYMGSRPIYLNERTWIGWIILIIVSVTVSVLSHYILMPWIYSIGKKLKKS